MRWAGKCKHFRLAKPGAHTATMVASNHAVSKNKMNIHANVCIKNCVTVESKFDYRHGPMQDDFRTLQNGKFDARLALRSKGR